MKKLLSALLLCVPLAAFAQGYMTQTEPANITIPDGSITANKLAPSSIDSTKVTNLSGTDFIYPFNIGTPSSGQYSRFDSKARSNLN